MKLTKAFILFFLIINSAVVLANTPQGKIISLKTGTYQIEYPNQLINVYFTLRPSGGFENLVTGLELSAYEQNEIVVKLRNQIDKLPQAFIGKFLSIDIFPLHIRDESIFGYYYDNQVVVEISKSKLARATYGSIESNFLHELAHRIYRRMEEREETKHFVDYLHAFHDINSPIGYFTKSELHSIGYVSRYASGRTTGTYEVDEEYPELFATLVWDKSRNELTEYMVNRPNSLMAQKLNKFMDYLEVVVPSIDRAYLFSKKDLAVLASTTNMEDELPGVHEVKPDESFGFEKEEENNIDKEEFGDAEITQDDLTETTYSNSTFSKIPYHKNTSEKYTSAFSVVPTPKENKRRRKKSRKSGKNNLSKMRAKDWGIAILTVGISIVAINYLDGKLDSTIAQNGWINRVKSKP